MAEAPGRLLREHGESDVPAGCEQVLRQQARRQRELVEREETVYNFEVEGTHTYCAGGLVVHNKPPVE